MQHPAVNPMHIFFFTILTLSFLNRDYSPHGVHKTFCMRLSTWRHNISLTHYILSVVRACVSNEFSAAFPHVFMHVCVCVTKCVWLERWEWVSHWEWVGAQNLLSIKCRNFRSDQHTDFSYFMWCALQINSHRTRHEMWCNEILSKHTVLYCVPLCILYKYNIHGDSAVPDIFMGFPFWKANNIRRTTKIYIV